ncbi:MAG: YggS family pyridoxal phosphate-dependent enzyme [Muribaculaceae bacterium]|nr:YggS family pyridoxal phosphate-dependent enzyme [Muribaculaceae bacterium]
MSSIAQRLNSLREEIPAGVELVAVSKFHPVEALMEAYDAGQRLFGESRVQEFVEKVEVLPKDIRWHFIGHLQTNKVRKVIGRAALIESVDTEHLLQYIDNESVRAGVVTRVLMQVHVAREETKFGFSEEELLDYFNSRRFESLKATHICGIMGMASNTDDESLVMSDFERIAAIYRTIRENESLGLRGFDTLSMGMSGDWRLAVKAGSNLIRIGTYIFGERQY